MDTEGQKYWLDQDFVLELLKQLPSYVFWKNTESIYLGCNDAFSHALGLSSPQEIIGKTDFDLPIVKEISAAYQADDREVIQSGKPKFNIEEPQIFLDGRKKTVLTNKVPLRNKDGSIIGVLGVYIDISDRKQAEKDKTHILEDIIANMPGYIYWKNINSEYMGCNKNLASVSELKTCSEIIGKRDEDFAWGSDQAENFRQDDQEVMKNGVIKVTEHILPNSISPDAYMYVRTEKIPLRNGEGKIIGILGVALDITDRKKAEDALKEQIKKTEEAYRSKTEFLSIASHEIRSPIGNVISLLDFVKQQCDKLSEITNGFVESSLDKSKKTEVIQINNKLAEHYDEVKAEAYRALNALINLGDLHRLQIEGIKCRFERYGIIDLVEQAITNSTYPNNRKVDLRLNAQPTVPKEVVMDWNNIYEALRVIVGNAIRFSKPNEVVNVQVTTEQENEKNYFVVTVQDNGVGISEGQLSHLLKTALDEEDMETRRFRKPSLQLPQAKMRVEASGGQMQIKSVVNEGTTVTLKIPYQNETALFTNAQPLKASHAQYMLLIEDDLLAQRIEKNHLENLGHRVDTAATGAEAIRLATTNSYDMIWLDITLPDMNGVNAMQKIREKIGDKTPFVAITSHASEDNIDYFISQDVMTVLTKPVTEQQFRDCIEDVLAAKEDSDQDDE